MISLQVPLIGLPMIAPSAGSAGGACGLLGDHDGRLGRSSEEGLRAYSICWLMQSPLHPQVFIRDFMKVHRSTSNKHKEENPEETHWKMRSKSQNTLILVGYSGI